MSEMQKRAVEPGKKKLIKSGTVRFLFGPVTFHGVTFVQV